METLTRMNKVVIEDYYHMTKMDENILWMKLIYLFLIFSLNLSSPLLYIDLCFKNLIAVLNIHPREKQYLLLMLCMLMPPIIPLSTLMLVSTWYEESTLRLSGPTLL